MDILRSDYLSSVRKQFEYYKQLGDKTFAQLEFGLNKNSILTNPKPYTFAVRQKNQTTAIWK